MKKLFITLFAITMLLAINIDVKASVTGYNSFSDFVNSYGVSGNRNVFTIQASSVGSESIVSSQGPVLTVYNTSNHNVLEISTSPFVAAWRTSQTSVNSATSNPIIYDNPIASLFNNYSGTYYIRSTSTVNYAIIANDCDIKWDGTESSLNTWLEQNPSNPNDPNAVDPNNLPMLKFGLTKKTVLGFPQITQIKEILTWDYTSEDVYKNNPTDFHMEMVASARWTTSPTGIGNIRDTSDKSINENCKVYITNGGCNISVNQYSWIYRDIGKSLYAIAGEPWDDNSGYFMYVRTVQDSNGKASAWKVYNLAMNGIVVQEDRYIEPDGTEKQLPDSQKDIGNGDGVQPAKFDNDSSTSSDSDPTSIRYDEGSGNFNVGTVISTLKSTVNQIIELPAILTQLLSFLPSWLTSLMVIGIGLAVTIGVVKMILH